MSQEKNKVSINGIEFNYLKKEGVRLCDQCTRHGKPYEPDGCWYAEIKGFQRAKAALAFWKAIVGESDAERFKGGIPGMDELRTMGPESARSFIIVCADHETMNMMAEKILQRAGVVTSRGRFHPDNPENIMGLTEEVEKNYYKEIIAPSLEKMKAVTPAGAAPTRAPAGAAPTRAPAGAAVAPAEAAPAEAAPAEAAPARAPAGADNEGILFDELIQVDVSGWGWGLVARGKDLKMKQVTLDDMNLAVEGRNDIPINMINSIEPDGRQGSRGDTDIVIKYGENDSLMIRPDLRVPAQQPHVNLHNFIKAFKQLGKDDILDDSLSAMVSSGAVAGGGKRKKTKRRKSTRKKKSTTKRRTKKRRTKKRRRR